MDNYYDAIARLDDELHGQNYELYTYLHDVISVAQADNTRLREELIAETLRANSAEAHLWNALHDKVQQAMEGEDGQD